MILNYITSFVEYLNNCEYGISTDKIEKCIKMFNDSGIDFADEGSARMLMQIAFCSTFEQRKTFHLHFKAFFKDRVELQELQNKKVELEKRISSSQGKAEETKIKYQKMLEKMTETKKDSPLNKKDRETLKKTYQLIKKSLPSPENEMMFELTEEHVKTKWKEKILQSLKKRLVNLSQESLYNGKLEKFEAMEKALKILNKKAVTDFIRGINEEKLSEQLEKELKKIKDKENADKQEREKIQKEIDQKIGKLIEKKNATSHRENFKNGKNAVHAYVDAPDCIDKTFNSLNDKEKSEIRHYIKNNLLKFKTRMNRNINTLNKTNLQMQETIQMACKTGGLPINLVFNKRVRGKSKLVLVLDVSGSCRQAAEMMLSFMWLLKDLFPRGCHMYCFTNKLYDVSKLMESENIDSAIKNVLDSIPRSGAYSNYYIPLETLWTEYKKNITKDSMMIFMGDARNNKNESGVEFLKEMSRRSKRCYWLNTDKVEKWDQGDSIASTYKKYSDMYEVTTIREMINFIVNMR